MIGKTRPRADDVKNSSARRTQGRNAPMVSHKNLIFALVIMAVFLDVMDFSVVNVALATIRAQFGTSLADVQWIIGAYGLTMAGLLMLSGRAGDIYGQKKLFISGVVLFTISSLVAGFSSSLLMLVILRGIQGVGAAISSVTAFSIFIMLFPEGRDRNKAMGVFMAVLSAGFAAGALAGGFLTAFLGWRSVFFINVPIGIVVAIMINRFLPESQGRAAGKQLDLPGAVTITAGLMLLVYALTAASSGDLASLQVLAPLALSLIILAAFFYIESRSASPLVPISFLRRGAILNANAAGLIVAAASGGLGVLITVFMQQNLGFSPFYAGLGFLPPALIFFIIGGWGLNPIMDWLRAKRALMASMVLIALGVALLIPISVQGGYFGILPGTVLWALGASIAFPALSIAAISGTKRGEEGLASGVITTSQRIGFPLGLALMVAVSAATAQTGSAASSVAGFRNAFILGEVLAIAAILLVLKMKIRHVKPMGGISEEFAEAALP